MNSKPRGSQSLRDLVDCAIVLSFTLHQDLHIIHFSVLISFTTLLTVKFLLISSMTQNWFEAALDSFKYTNEEASPYKDTFHEVRKILRMWNDNMDQYFNPEWITCIDNIMSVWSNNYNRPYLCLCLGRSGHLGTSITLYDTGCQVFYLKYNWLKGMTNQRS